jgi:putative transposase
MNYSRCNEYLYSQFLIATQKNYSCSELARVSPNGMAHDAANRMLLREKLVPKIIWDNVKHCVELNCGYLILDDTVIDKSSSQNIGLTYWQYSGDAGKSVNGIGLITLLWTKDGNEHIPIDYRIYDPNGDGKTKNDHFQEMLQSAKYRGFNPEFVLFDSWYSSIENLKTIDGFGWKWVTRMKKNRIVSVAPKQYSNLENLDIPPEGLVVHLKAYGFIKVFKIVFKNGNIEYLATNNTNISASAVEGIYGKRWNIEIYHKGLKQQCGVEKCQARISRIQRNHIWCSITAFIVLELHRIKTGTSLPEAKISITRSAIREYLLAPRFQFSQATA